MIDNQDILELIQILNSKEVKYMLVGGYAVMHYAEPRYTKDVDFFVKASAKNADKMIQALVEFGVPEDQLDKNLFANPGNFFKLGNPPWRVDFITSLEGVDFDSIYKNIQHIKLKDNKLPIISKTDLIKVKQEAGRPQDLVDVKLLEDS